MPTMETFNQQTESRMPCMGALTFKILTNLWSNQTEDENCQCVSEQVKAVLGKYPNGGEQCLEEIFKLAEENKEICNESEREKWIVVHDLASQRIASRKTSTN